MSRVIFLSLLQDKTGSTTMKQLRLMATTTLLIVCMIFATFDLTSFTASAESSNSTWQISIGGLVSNPSNFTLSDLEAMPQTTISATLYCVDYPTTVVAGGNWQGVKLWDLLSKTGVLPGAIKVAFSAIDDFTTDLTIDTAKSDNIILAYAKDGVPLTETLRLVVPGHWGYKWIAQVTNIELVNYDFTGKWESQGYSDDAFITQQPTIPSSSFLPSPSATTQTTPSPIITASPGETPTTSPSTSPSSTSSQPNSSSLLENVITHNFALIGIIVIIAIPLVATTLAIKKKKKPLTP